MNQPFHFGVSGSQRTRAWVGVVVVGLAWAMVGLAMAPGLRGDWLGDGNAILRWVLWGGWAACGAAVFAWRVVRVQVVSLIDEGVEVVTRLGPWRRRLVVPRGDVLEVLTRADDGALYARTPKGAVTLVTAGGPVPRSAVKARLRELLDLGHVVRTALPVGFVEAEREGRWVIGRSFAGRVGWGVVGALGLAAGAAVGQAWVVGLAAIVLVGAVAREEWLASAGAVERRWRVGPLRWQQADRLTDLHLESEEVSDQGTWFHLVARSPRVRRVVLSALDDAEAPAALGEHLARRAGLRLAYGPGCEAVAPQ